VNQKHPRWGELLGERFAASPVTGLSDCTALVSHRNQHLVKQRAWWQMIFIEYRVSWMRTR
jgi:hypothetical protein